MLNYFSMCHFKVICDSEECNIILYPSPSFMICLLEYGYFDVYVNGHLRKPFNGHFY